MRTGTIQHGPCSYTPAPSAKQSADSAILPVSATNNTPPCDFKMYLRACRHHAHASPTGIHLRQGSRSRSSNASRKDEEAETCCFNSFVNELLRQLEVARQISHTGTAVVRIE